ncbi:MAG: hypothetical protein P8Y70_18170 [Candidatus Lokiarchaeota archaeon]
MADPLRTPREVKDEIDELDSQIQNIIDTRKFTENYLPENIPFLIEKVSDKLNLTQKLKFDLEKDDNLEVDLIFKAFHKIEQLLNEFEVKINPLLREINLNISLNLSISKITDKFLIEPKFQRNKEKKLKFNDLTTPEKVYITICFIIVIQLINNLKQIIVSNTFLPEKFNKKGSIFRTIKKLLNLVRNDQSFKDISLTFIIKNFEPKKMIQNLNVIKINEIVN